MYVRATIGATSRCLQWVTDGSLHEWTLDGNIGEDKAIQTKKLKRNDWYRMPKKRVTKCQPDTTPTSTKFKSNNPKPTSIASPNRFTFNNS